MLASTALWHARRRAGLTQRELAAIAGVAQSTVARIESGAIDPRVSTLDGLLRSCGEELRAVERIGVGEDRSLARESLRRTAAERLRQAVHYGNAVERMAAHARR
jgi:predicted transcriptional regulator